MNKTTAAIILSLVCDVSYQALGEEIEVKSLNRSFTGFFVRDRIDMIAALV